MKWGGSLGRSKQKCALLLGGEVELATGFNGDFSMDYPDLGPGCNPVLGGVTYLNVNCFSLAPPVAGGVLVRNAGRNRFYGPGLKTVTSLPSRIFGSWSV